MNTKMPIIFVALFAVLSLAAQAQSDNWRTKNILSFNWEIATPLNTDYLTSTSLAGANFEFKHFVSPKISVGLGMHWNTFEEYLSQRVYEKPDGSQAFFTDLVPQVYVLPILAKAHYYFNAGNSLKPYAGLGVGAQYSQQSVYYNIFVSETKNWGFALRPELGLMYQFKYSNGGLNLNVGFNYATNENADFDLGHLKHVGYSIGGWWNLY